MEIRVLESEQGGGEKGFCAQEGEERASGKRRSGGEWCRVLDYLITTNVTILCSIAQCEGSATELTMSSRCEG